MKGIIGFGVDRQEQSSPIYSIYVLLSSAGVLRLSIKVPDRGNAYSIDEFVFYNDPFLTREKRVVMENRGGSGILQLTETDHLQIAEHNIILGLNIPNYPREPARE